jgi:hypothetical protein
MLTPWKMMLVWCLILDLHFGQRGFFLVQSQYCCGLITAAFRIIQGGAGMWMGVLVIVYHCTGLFGKSSFHSGVRKDTFIIIYCCYIAHSHVALHFALPRELIIPH